MELSDDPRSREPEEAPPALLSCMSPVKRNSYSVVHSTSNLLRRKDKLEKRSLKECCSHGGTDHPRAYEGAKRLALSLLNVTTSSADSVDRQGGVASTLPAPDSLPETDGAQTCERGANHQKCIALFALLCCLAVLMALIFSSVNVWGDDEDGITEENCSRDCRIELVENIPDDLYLHTAVRAHLPLSAGFHSLLDQAKHSLELVSPVWALNPWGAETTPHAAKQGQLLFQRLLGLESRGVKLKIASSLSNSAELETLAAHNADVRFVNMTALTRGGLHSSFWIVDRRHIYIGSADMDWRSLSKLHDKDYIPSIWSKRVTALYGRHGALELQLNASEAAAYVSTSPEVFCAKDRTRDVDAIYQVMQSAKAFVFISVTDYLPLLSRRLRGTSVTRYWSHIDEVIREAAVLRGVRVRLLISFWKKTHPLTFNFVTSLESLCLQLLNCSIEVRFFSHKEHREDFQHGLNHNKYMVTDNALYIGNHDFVGSDFAVNAGVGLVVKMKSGVQDRGATIVEQITAAFERDWRSRYAKSLQRHRDQHGKFRHLHQSKVHPGKKEGKEWNEPLSF